MRELESHQELLSEVSSGNSIVLFHASWCPACQNYSPMFEKQAHKFAGATKFLRFDMDKFRNDLPSNMEMLSANVRAYPTLMSFKHTPAGVRAFVSANGERGDDVIEAMADIEPNLTRKYSRDEEEEVQQLNEDEDVEHNVDVYTNEVQENQEEQPTKKYSEENQTDENDSKMHADVGDLIMQEMEELDDDELAEMENTDGDIQME